MSYSERIFGKDWNQRAVLIVAIFVYLVTWVINPNLAESCANTSLQEIQKLMIPIAAAIFLGGLMKNLMTPKSVSRFFGSSEPRRVFTAGVIGSILPPCPYAAYPLIRTFNDAGITISVLMMMLITSTVVEIPQIFAGIAILGIEIEGLRILFAFLSSLIVGYLFLFYTNRQKKLTRPVLAS